MAGMTPESRCQCEGLEMNEVNPFWLVVMNIALGLAVLGSVFVVVVSLIEEMWIRHPAIHPHWFSHRWHGHPGRITVRHRFRRL